MPVGRRAVASGGGGGGVRTLPGAQLSREHSRTGPQACWFARSGRRPRDRRGMSETNAVSRSRRNALEEL